MKPGPWSEGRLSIQRESRFCRSSSKEPQLSLSSASAQAYQALMQKALHSAPELVTRLRVLLGCQPCKADWCGPHTGDTRGERAKGGDCTMHQDVSGLVLAVRSQIEAALPNLEAAFVSPREPAAFALQSILQKVLAQHIPNFQAFKYVRNSELATWRTETQRVGKPAVLKVLYDAWNDNDSDSWLDGATSASLDMQKAAWLRLPLQSRSCACCADLRRRHRGGGILWTRQKAKV